MHTVDLDNVIVTHESGSPREQVVPFWEARHPRSFIGWGKSTQLGYSLGLAMGAKMAAPEKQVINIMGDAAFGTVGLDIETAVRAEIPILTIVLNNSYMAIYGDGYFPVAADQWRAKELSGQFAEVAQAMGAFSGHWRLPALVAPPCWNSSPKRKASTLSFRLDGGRQLAGIKKHYQIVVRQAHHERVGISCSVRHFGELSAGSELVEGHHGCFAPLRDIFLVLCIRPVLARTVSSTYSATRRFAGEGRGAELSWVELE